MLKSSIVTAMSIRSIAVRLRYTFRSSWSCLYPCCVRCCRTLSVNMCDPVAVLYMFLRSIEVWPGCDGVSQNNGTGCMYSVLGTLYGSYRNVFSKSMCRVVILLVSHSAKMSQMASRSAEYADTSAG